MTAWMIYGANGYTGELIAREAHRRGLRPILAGRNPEAISKLAAELGCPARVFTLSDTAALATQLANLTLVLNCAGPFSATAIPLLDACLSTGVHYLDITGEIDVIEAAAARHKRAQQAGSVVIPAVGFDVVPSDCLAAMLKEKFSGATRLQLAFSSTGSISPGTAKTTLEALGQGGRVRKGGRIVRVSLAAKTREIPFADGVRLAVIIPWGDVASAYYSTGIGNIEVYMAMPPRRLRTLRRWRWLLPLLRWSPLQAYGKRRIAQTTTGPTAAQRANNRVSLWGRVEDDAGQGMEATMTLPDGYEVTVRAALASVEQVLGGQIPPGFHTPAQAFGREFILSLPGIELHFR